MPHYDHDSDETQELISRRKIQAAMELADAEQFILLAHYKNEDGIEGVKTTVCVTSENPTGWLEALNTAGMSVAHEMLGAILENRGEVLDREESTDPLLTSLTEEDFERLLGRDSGDNPTEEEDYPWQPRRP